MEYIIENSTLMKEWNWEKNNEVGLVPSTLKCKSNKKAWWICALGHIWEARISDRTAGTKCPYCTGRKVLSGFNDLQTTHPYLIQEWDWNKNTIMPNEITAGSGKQIFWKCRFGHQWQAKVYNRAKGDGCPYCSGHRAIEGLNDLMTTYPKIAAEWNYQKNNNLLPTQVLPKSNKTVWWICEFGHEWQAKIGYRTDYNIGCPNCNKELHVSSKEMVIYYYIHKYFLNAVSSYGNKILNSMEIDIFIPELNIGIEYDGQAWHQDVSRDLRKDNICYTNNINLIRIREPECPKYESTCTFVYLKTLSWDDLSSAIEYILKKLNINEIDIDFSRDLCEIESMFFHKKKNSSLAELYPEIAAEWHPTKNGNLTPDCITYGSGKKVWWKCKVCGHEWMATIGKRTSGRGCPSCANDKRRSSTSKSVFCIELNRIFSNTI